MKNRIVVASATSEVIRFEVDRSPKGRRGGHLVVVFGFRWNGKAIEGYFLHNPSGGSAETRDSVFVPIRRFQEAFAERGYSIWENS